MTKLVIVGAGGRMGRAILDRALADKAVRVTGLVETPKHPLVGKELEGVRVTADVRGALKGADALIDFTAPAATLKNAEAAAAARKAMVVGTTGLAGEEREKFVKTVKGIPAVLSPNMSLSANVLFDAAERLAKLLADYDVEISETHHNLKKDAPSGTAQRLAEAVARGRGTGVFVYGRKGLVGQRTKPEIGVHALRGGDVVGDHTVFYFGAGERIELTHRVTSREAFAQGAVVAAKWAAGRKPGLYDMADVLGLKAGARD